MPYTPIRKGAGRLWEYNLDQMLQELFASIDALSSTSNGEGASSIGIEDAGGAFTATDVEAALVELEARIAALEP